MTQQKWGIIGPGGIAHQFAQALAGVEAALLYAVASRSQQRAQDFADQYQAQKVYASYADMLANPDVEFVYIATPHSHHFDAAKISLEAGKHVLMEKPLTVNAKQAEVLFALAQQKGLVLQEALWSRFMPCFAQVKKWLEQGKIGKLKYIQSQIGFAKNTDLTHRLMDPALAGGSILDLGVYSISLSNYLLDLHPTDIQASAIIGDTQVDEVTMVNMRYANKVMSQFTCTNSAQANNQMTLLGEQGEIHLPAFFWNGNAASLIQDGQTVEHCDFPHPVNGFEYQIEATMQAAAQGLCCDPRMNHVDSLQVMRCMDEVRGQISLAFSDEIESV